MEVPALKKYASLLFITLLFVACSKPAPGAKETGYEGISWGADVTTAAKTLGAKPAVTSADALFGSYPGFAPRLVTMMDRGLSTLITGKAKYSMQGMDALKGMSMLSRGAKGYALFFNHGFGMNLTIAPPDTFQAEHDKLMHRYGLIDKKREYMANEYETSYMIMWHNADGVIILAKETYKQQPSSDNLITAMQIIHMDKRVYKAIAADFAKEKKAS